MAESAELTVLVNGVPLNERQINDALRQLDEQKRRTHTYEHGQVYSPNGAPRYNYIVLDREKVKRMINHAEKMGNPFIYVQGGGTSDNGVHLGSLPATIEFGTDRAIGTVGEFFDKLK